MTKKIIQLTITVILLSACATLPATPGMDLPASAEIVETKMSLATEPPTSTPAPTETPTLKPTNTPIPPTETSTPTPAPTALGGGSGLIRMFINVNIVEFPLQNVEKFRVLVPIEKIMSEFEIAEFSTMRTDYISPNGDIAAVWNCASNHCDTVRGDLYLFTLDWKHKAGLDVAGMPYFLGMSADQTRMLYYLESTMANDFYLVKTNPQNFGEVISLGRMSDVNWAFDRQTLYAQKGSTVSRLDLDGKELKTFECNFNNDCIHAQSPDGKRFVGIQKYVPTGMGNPVITISDAEFTDKKSIFISDDDALILAIDWLPDNQHIAVYGQTARQRTRRFWRLDYLSFINVDSGEERVVELDIPEDSEWFGPCSLTPDGNHLVYLGAGGRIKQEGRILMSGRFALMFPVSSEAPVFERITLFDGSWESCPVWIP